MHLRHRVRPTGRGLALAGAGLATATTGVLGGTRVLTQVGLLLVLTVLVSAVLLRLELRQQDRGALRLNRRVTPHPTTVGRPTTVEVEVVSTTGHRLDRLDVAERASRELSGPRPLRARVRRERDRLTLVYPVEPGRRGRWAVGPLEVRRRDLFGVAHASGPLGDPVLVAVRPVLTHLTTDDPSTSTDVDRAALGSRTPAADDASLRDYRPGDDLRRVHWRSSARRGAVMVRQDERSGRRPASVLLDVAVEDAAAEWSIATAASVSLALLEARHGVRLLGGEAHGTPAAGRTDHHRTDVHGEASEALLEQVVDLTLPRTEAERTAWLLAAVDTLTAQAGGAELVFAVVGALGPAELTALARVGDASHGWAMVRSAGASPTDDEARTLAQLRRAGWTACAVTVGEDPAAAWERLLGSHDALAVPR
ncbi:DUF58 domain-containing protein [Cellulomonas sp. APG4]|uniref:DUF58 domain-containing protein n=1 Tax=Cellulomonas sp. APG4 TaxID=1538656 RepID=UPI00137A1227|nr:DUF58 domain-containing protein [Cellulomonas sp. APG4]NCT92077.1 DUF58 domain-containing protein [Cellulomonas sp. APG4]